MAQRDLRPGARPHGGVAGDNCTTSGRCRWRAAHLDASDSRSAPPPAAVRPQRDLRPSARPHGGLRGRLARGSRRLGAVAGGRAGMDGVDSLGLPAGRAVHPQRHLRPGARPHGGLRGLRRRGTPYLRRRLGAVAGGHAGLGAVDPTGTPPSARAITARSTTQCATAWWSSGAMTARHFRSDVWALSLGHAELGSTNPRRPAARR